MTDDSKDFTQEISVTHNIPPELTDTLNFPEGEVKVKRDDDETDLDSMTPSEKIEWAREEYGDSE